MEDEQLSISGIPGNSRRQGSGGERPTRASSRLVTIRNQGPPRKEPPVRPVGSTLAASAGAEGCEAMAACDVYALGVRTDLVTACRIALGVGSTTAYALAGRGELPFPVYRVGRQWVVPTAGLLAFLGLPPLESRVPVTPESGSTAQG